MVWSLCTLFGSKQECRAQQGRARRAVPGQRAGGLWQGWAPREWAQWSRTQTASWPISSTTCQLPTAEGSKKRSGSVAASKGRGWLLEKATRTRLRASSGHSRVLSHPRVRRQARSKESTLATWAIQINYESNTSPTQGLLLALQSPYLGEVEGKKKSEEKKMKL